MVRACTLRRISQAAFFFIIVFIGVAGISNLGLALQQSQAEQLEQESALAQPPSGYYEILDTYGPAKTCRYVAGDARLFRGCALHYFSKTLTTFAAANLLFVLPHLLFFFGLALVFGRAFCGWVCPMGFLSEVMVFSRKKLGVRHFKISEPFKRKMAGFRYAFLSFIIILSLAIAVPFLGLMSFQKELYIPGCQICPARIVLPFVGELRPVIYSFTSPIVIAFSAVGIALLALYLPGAVFRRPWCRICPSGAMLSLFDSWSLLSKEKDVRKCSKCGICARFCPMDNKNVYLEKEKKELSSSNCIRCFRCIENCPEDGCLTLRIFGKTIYRSGGKIGRRVGCRL